MAAVRSALNLIIDRELSSRISLSAPNARNSTHMLWHIARNNTIHGDRFGIVLLTAPALAQAPVADHKEWYANSQFRFGSLHTSICTVCAIRELLYAIIWYGSMYRAHRCAKMMVVQSQLARHGRTASHSRARVVFGPLTASIRENVPPPGRTARHQPPRSSPTSNFSSMQLCLKTQFQRP